MRYFLTAVVSVSFGLSAFAQDDTELCRPETGDMAPDFTTVDDRNRPWKLSDHLNERVLVIYFYPADMTRQCSQQACEFRDQMQALEEAGVQVVGVSGDTVENHRLFKQAYKLPYTLLADVDGRVARAFGVPVRDGGKITRIVNGRRLTLQRGVTATRWTFVIAPDGRILHRNTDVDAENGVADVLDVVRTLTAASD